jgi:thiol-disulfide isomerase/thioredoxin
MSAISSLALVAILGITPGGSTPSHAVGAPVPANGGATLVQFSSQRCVHCQAMQPIVASLMQQGCPVQAVDVDQQPDLAKQLRVVGVPTYLALVEGREVGRIEGATSLEKLAALVKGPGVRGQEAGGRSQESGDRGQGTGVRETAQHQGTAVGGGSAAAEQAARAATVRLKVEDAGGYGFGTGTIIDTHESEALAVTCGHLFRESQGKGKVTADIFASGTSQTVEGQVIAYDLDRDIALVSLRVPLGLRAVAVAPPGHQVRPGDRAFTIGCDKGADPSLRPTHITAVNKYKGKPNFTAAGQPVDGRSGGGLFTADGLLIGICNAADPADDEGLYAGLASIHWQLDQIGQSEIYQRSSKVASATVPQDSSVALAAARDSVMPPQVPATPIPSPLAQASPPVPQLSPQMPAGSTPTVAASELAPVAAAGDDTEIVFIVRSKNNPAQRSEVYVVEQAPPDLIARITHAARATGEQRAALARANASVASRPAGMPPQMPAAPIVRAQSGAY